MEKASSARVHMWSAGKHDESSFLLHLHCALFGSCTVARGQEMYLNLYIYTPPTFCNRGVHDTVLNILSMYEYWISLLVLFIFSIVLWYLGTLLVLLYACMAISRSYPRHLVQFHFGSKNSYNMISVHNRSTLWKFVETENILLTNAHQFLKRDV